MQRDGGCFESVHIKKNVEEYTSVALKHSIGPNLREKARSDEDENVDVVLKAALRIK